MSVFDILKRLSLFWSDAGCTILPSYDKEVGAATQAPWTMLYALGPRERFIAYSQLCRRPADSRFASNPSRLQRYIQYQVLLKPHYDCMQEIIVRSLEDIGLHQKYHDIRFISDNWSNAIIGAYGVGWEVWCDGMEIAQCTYFQKMCAHNVEIVSGEITYGIERLAMIIQNKDSIFDISYDQKSSYQDIFYPIEKDFSVYYRDYVSVDYYENQFDKCASFVESIFERGNAGYVLYPLVEEVMHLSHIFNILDTKGALSALQRRDKISIVRSFAHRIGFLCLGKSA